MQEKAVIVWLLSIANFCLREEIRLESKPKKLFLKKYIYIAVVAIVFLGICAGGYLYKTKGSEASTQAPTFIEQEVAMGDITIDFMADGVADIPFINVDFEISGKLNEVLVEVGQQVNKGDVIAKLDDTDDMNRVNSAQINYEKAQKDYEEQLISEKQNLNELKSRLDSITLEYEPMTQIACAFSKQEIERKRLEYENMKLAYEAQLQTYNMLSDINVRSAQLSLKIAQDDYEDTILTAPIDAKVFAINYEPGETVAEIRTRVADDEHFMLLTNTDKINVIAPVCEIDLGNITIGQSVEVAFEAFEGQSFAGRVLSVDPLPKRDNSGLVTYDVNIELDEDMDKIKTGMTCTINFILRQKKHVLVIPNKAVTLVDGKQSVQVKDEKGNIISRTIKAGLTDGINVEVIDGLEAGETVMVSDKR